MGKPGSIRAAFGAALKRSGVGSDLRFHNLRHEAVTRLFEKGLNPIEVGMISGHRSMSMLQRYTHMRPEGLLARLA
jgi:integrase